MGRPSLREKLASSAVDTLHANGFKGCSIQDITQAAGVPKGSFFNHFENKEDLAIDALRRYLEGTRSEMLFDESVPPLERLKALAAPFKERHKPLVFGLAFALLVASGGATWYSRALPCPTEPMAARSCQRLRRINVALYSIGLVCFALGLTFAYLLPRLT